jgi:hypothetical protein
MQFSITDSQTGWLVGEVFRKLPAKERKQVESRIAAVTDCDIVTVVRPLMFGGKVVHELYFDPCKLTFFTRREKLGAIASAFVISCLAQNEVPLSDQTLRTHAKQIYEYGKRLKFGNEVSAFLRRFRTLEDEWRDSD